MGRDEEGRGHRRGGGHGEHDRADGGSEGRGDGRDGRGEGRKPRTVAPPRVPPGALREFKRYLYRLYLTAGAPSLEGIAALIAEDDGLPGAPGKDTVARLLSGGRLPRLQDAESVAAVLGREADHGRDPAEVVARTRELWVAANENPVPPLRTVEEWGPFRLGVHHAVAADGQRTDPLTPYIERNHDETLRDRLRQAAVSRQSVLVVLVGQSSTGKTRAGYEAVRAELPGWPLLFPADAEELAGWVAADAVDARSVLWLNETQRYLSGTAGEVAARALATLLERVTPLAVVGSMWPEYARKLTARPAGTQDRNFHARGLLELHRAEIHVPDHFAGGLPRVGEAAARDPRLAAALRVAGAEARVLQQLTGGPELVRRYDEGPGNAFTEIEHAVLTAAVDARRLGHTSALPAELLAEAVAGYLPTTARVTHDRDWFAAAVAALCPRPHANGTLTALVPDRVAPGLGAADGYHPADYLDQSVRRSRGHLAPPAQLWQAAERHARTADDLYALGHAAEDRRRYGHALRLYQRAVDHGSPAARAALASLLDAVGDHIGAEAAAADCPRAWAALAMAREAGGDLPGAERAYRVAAETGEPWAWAPLARIRENAEDPEGAEEIACRAAAEGHPQVWLTLARLRERSSPARSRARPAPGAGTGTVTGRPSDPASGPDPVGGGGTANGTGVHEGATANGSRTSPPRGAEPALEGRLPRGTGTRLPAPPGRCVPRVDAHASRPEEAPKPGGTAATAGVEGAPVEPAERAYAAAAAAGEPWGWLGLARLRERAGDVPGAETAYGQAAAAGVTAAWTHLVQLRRRSGDPAGAEEAAVRAAEYGDAEAWSVLARLLEQQGDLPGAERGYAAAAATGASSALARLAGLREECGDRPGAERAAVDAGRDGDGEAWSTLARLREAAGDGDGAEYAAAQASRTGDAEIWTVLARLREAAGDRVGAERAADEAAENGDPDAWAALSRIRERAEDRRGSECAVRRAVDVGGTGAWAALGRVREQHGDAPAAERAYLAATALGDTDAWGDLARLYEETGDRRRAEQAYRTAVDAGDTEAWGGLLRVLRPGGGRRLEPRRRRHGLDAAGGFAEVL
ncbi:hypothetical protein [Streptomyces sp. SAJ15]|uniref:hypothetical protein n=1 Tax=Streptomyces sp. SAJ15 TaxID=2011095 RepID=UPI00118663FA|nr:hypothetical protein [Streptomyces sp. SAJ15]TVL91879.1 hypothetical protein CD790_14420 [Streptomyces sp. SAJ15]